MVTAGGVLSTVHEYEAVGPTLPARSIAVTWNVWAVADTVMALGDVQPAGEAESRAQLNTAPGSEAVNANCAEVDAVSTAGDDVMLTVGGVTSTVHGYTVGFPTLLSSSVARTENECDPSATPLYVLVPEHAE
jgi:hypothetical protein